MKTIKNKHLWTSALVGAVIAGGALAGNVTLPNVFQANTPARASEVNANFNAVKTAVDDNAAHIQILDAGMAQLDARLNTLQTGLNGTQTALVSMQANVTTLQSDVTTLQTADGRDWKRGGNTGTSLATDYIGTADNQGLELRVNAIRAVQILPSGSSDTPNVLIAGTQCPPALASGAKGVFIGGGNAFGHLALCRAWEVPRAYDNNVAVIGGFGNAAGSDDADLTNSEYAAVLGGVFNTATGYASVTLAGDSNVASGAYSVVAGGHHNQATGTASLAAGGYARAVNDNSIVFSAAASSAPFASTTTGQFAVRASGGIYFGGGSATSATVPSGAFLATSTGATLSTGGTWTNSSDVALKANLSPVNDRDVLQALREMPVYSWNYKSESASVRHIGPTAQDFAAHFALGQDDKHIATVDADGVALAAVKGLAELVEDQRRLIEAQRRELEALRTRVQTLERTH